MANSYTPPIISVAFNMDEGQYQPMATSHSHTAIAGERIFRGEPWPSVRWSHADGAAAEKDAAVLREYLEECASGKQKESGPRAKGWWQ